MSIITRGFRGRRQDDDTRLPPGQYLTRDFPVLSAGPTPRVSLDTWEFSITTETGQAHQWTWAELMALPAETSWSTSTASPAGPSSAPTGAASPWTRCSPTSRRAADFALAHCYGGYTTNLPLDGPARRARRGWRYEFDGEPLAPEHGGPARLLVPHLYFWKSAKWVQRPRPAPTMTSPGSGSSSGYHDYGDPWREQRYQGD